MTNYKLPNVVYHATLLQHLDSIKEKILIHRKNARSNLDFGKGFYTTSNYQQAEKWAYLLQQRERNPHNNVLSKKDRGIIISFDLDTQLLYNLPKEQWTFFLEANLSWAMHIFYNRFSKNIPTTHPFKWTYGPLADGTSLNMLCSKYARKIITKNDFLSEIKPISSDHHQLSFHEDEDFVNAALKFRDFEIINSHAAIKGG